jgi:hypothetical protein
MCYGESYKYASEMEAITGIEIPILSAIEVSSLRFIAIYSCQLALSAIYALEEVAA